VRTTFAWSKAFPRFLIRPPEVILLCAAGATAAISVGCGSRLYGAGGDYRHADLVHRLLPLAVIVAVFFMLLPWCSMIWMLLREYFDAATAPLNLAVFRIVLFTALYPRNPHLIIALSRLPKAALIPPFGWRPILAVLPITPALAQAGVTGLAFCCCLGIIGLWTRISAALATVTGLYVLGIPQFYGKVDHGRMHLLWFATLLALSPCADVLSVDAIIVAWRRGSSGVVAAPGNSSRYAQPLRFVWLLIGIIYLFPGLWKACNVGLQWAVSDNLRNQMYRKWYQFGGWTPSWRIDLHPPVYHLAGIGALLFELSFIFLVLTPRLRSIAAVGGLCFHSLIRYFMRISFFTLELCYVSFIDWQRVAEASGRWLFREPLIVFYDGRRKVCRRVVACLGVLDVLHRVEYIDVRGEPVPAHSFQVQGVVPQPFSFWATGGCRSSEGLGAGRAIVARMPLLWPIYLLLYLWPPQLVRSTPEAEIGDVRVRQGPSPDHSGLIPAAVRSASLGIGIRVAGCTLLIGNAIFGFSGITASWPFACYPTFAGTARVTRTVIIMTIDYVDGTSQEVDMSRDLARLLGMHTRRFDHINSVLLAEPEQERLARAKAIFQTLQLRVFKWHPARQVSFYYDEISIIPGASDKDLVNRQLMCSFSP
jgi:predicted DCC family thiol-disulfide oxidoreductase YuxK